MPTGLSTSDVKTRKKLGLTNQAVDSFIPSTPTILRRNFFNLINLTFLPVIVALIYFDLEKEILAFGIFGIVNSLVSSLDEIRIKKQLQKIKEDFKLTATVIRDGAEHIIPINEIVKGDYVKVKEGEGIFADGKVEDSRFLLLDESSITGESEYIGKNKDDQIYSGSFVVTGECIYIAEKVGSNNYLNKLATQATKYHRTKSKLEKDGLYLTLFFVVSAILSGLINLAFTRPDATEDRLLSIATIIALIIPQTLIFLFTLSFTISVTKLSNKGILVQKGSSIDDLSNVDVLCIDKTGTITTNEMKISEVKYFNIDDKQIGSFLLNIKDQIVSKNKTLEAVIQHYEQWAVSSEQNQDLNSKAQNPKLINQSPFTSKNKFSSFTSEIEGNIVTLTLGAPSELEKFIDEEVKAEVLQYVNEQELLGNRVVIALHNSSLGRGEGEGLTSLQSSAHSSELTAHTSKLKTHNSKHITIFSIHEELNPGINEVISRLKEQGITLKIISGDSLLSVSKIAEKIGIDSSKIIELSDSNRNYSEIINNTVFTRATPDDKLELIKALKAKGHKVAMIGDGVNDVLGIKLADVGIAMESGAKITREIADIVLLKNDYKKIPDIFFEADNIIFNLKFSTKSFLATALFAVIFSNIFSFFYQNPVPIYPSSTLISSFLVSGLPSYIIVFTRQSVESSAGFLKECVKSALLAGVTLTIVAVINYEYALDKEFKPVQINTIMIMSILSFGMIYTIYLLHQAKKLKSYYAAFFAYLFMLGAGIMQTILPITQYKDTNELIFLIIIVAIGLLIVGSVSTQIIEDKLRRVLAVLGIFCTLPLILIFPFDNYYTVERLPFESYLFCIAVALSLGTLMIIAKTFTRLLTR